jgi:hypothetical protein
MNKDKILELLDCLETDCDMALADIWDRSDEGFIAMLTTINDIRLLLDEKQTIT